MIVTQALITSILSIQWVIGQIYLLVQRNRVKTIQETYTVLLIASLSITFYALNNVKSFYFSILISKFYRNSFVKGLKRIFCK